MRLILFLIFIIALPINSYSFLLFIKHDIKNNEFSNLKFTLSITFTEHKKNKTQQTKTSYVYNNLSIKTDSPFLNFCAFNICSKDKQAIPYYSLEDGPMRVLYNHFEKPAPNQLKLSIYLPWLHQTVSSTLSLKPLQKSWDYSELSTFTEISSFYAIKATLLTTNNKPELQLSLHDLESSLLNSLDLSLGLQDQEESDSSDSSECSNYWSDWDYERESSDETELTQAIDIKKRQNELNLQEIQKALDELMNSFI